jgi:hypothetical protein
MREQYQGQLSASMLYILLCGTGFITGSFFIYEGFFYPKNKKHRNFLRCQSQNGDVIAAKSVDKLKGLHRVELQGKKSLRRLAIVILLHVVPPDVNSRAAASAGFWRL